ncbi:Aste57867_5618 [Aphanomyces stellatus]|uniref:Aste57867_5618 protein n=1 Tax=Aphanomyces stellatus TaxID=120398 RepID=A0A485KES5_9STRA|nr:hypothetical protein As57867_005605 [Aphanomyces stellatus]VFT82664.1 Aste57867_5618 [Aphanomyces stellatus]
MSSSVRATIDLTRLDDEKASSALAAIDLTEDLDDEAHSPRFLKAPLRSGSSNCTSELPRACKLLPTDSPSSDDDDDVEVLEIRPPTIPCPPSTNAQRRPIQIPLVDSDDDEDALPSRSHEMTRQKRYATTRESVGAASTYIHRLPPAWTFPTLDCLSMWQLWFRGDRAQGLGPLRFLTDASIVSTNIASLAMFEGTSVVMHVLLSNVKACEGFGTDNDVAALSLDRLTSVFLDAFARIFPGRGAADEPISAFFPASDDFNYDQPPPTMRSFPFDGITCRAMWHLWFCGIPTKLRTVSPCLLDANSKRHRTKTQKLMDTLTAVAIEYNLVASKAALQAKDAATLDDLFDAVIDAWREGFDVAFSGDTLVADAIEWIAKANESKRSAMASVPTKSVPHMTTCDVVVFERRHTRSTAKAESMPAIGLVVVEAARKERRVMKSNEPAEPISKRLRRSAV